MLYNYADTDLDDNLICCICRTPFNEPVTTRTCFHTFCHGCILQALSVSNHCPIDRSPLSVELLGQADPIVRHLVEELIVRCPYSDAGCEYIGERHLLRSHLKLQCSYVRVPCLCSDKSCKRTVSRKDAPDGQTTVHQESDREPDGARAIACEFCGEEFSHFSAMESHLASSCLEKVVSCNQAGNGCTWKGRRLSLKAHVDKCPYESIKGFFAIHNNGMKQLSEDNERLRRRTEELEGLVRILTQELEWAKIALGPWYRTIYTERQPLTASYTRYPNDEDARVGPGPSGAVPVLLRSTPMTGGTSNPEHMVESITTEAFDLFDPFSFVGQTQNHDRSTHAAYNESTATIPTSSGPNLSTRTSSHPVESGDGDGLDLGEAISGSEPIPHVIASESREELEEGPGIHSPDRLPISGFIHPHPTWSHSAPCSQPQFTPSIHKHVVAPLNLSTTVEGSLVGLRESLVTLSEALESQGRRLELSLTTEGLRASEEVGSLKATVQGLRMQVHAIMMDRNALVTGRIGGMLNMPSNVGVRPQQSPGPGEEGSNEGSGSPRSEENGLSSPGGLRSMEGYYGSGGLYRGLSLQQPIPPGVAIPMMGPNVWAGPPLAGVRFNHINQGGGGPPLGGLPMSPYQLYLSPTAGSGPKL